MLLKIKETKKLNCDKTYFNLQKSKKIYMNSTGTSYDEIHYRM